MKRAAAADGTGERAGFKPAPTAPSRKGDDKGGCGRRHGDRAGFQTRPYDAPRVKGMKRAAAADGTGERAGFKPAPTAALA